MQGSDIIIDDFVVVPDTASLRHAALSMREHDADVLLVEQGKRVVGTLRWRDLARPSSFPAWSGSNLLSLEMKAWQIHC
jgi:CBS-domain-containing membrane protein